MRSVAALCLLCSTACTSAAAGTFCQPDVVGVLGDSIPLLIGAELQTALGRTYSVNDIAVGSQQCSYVLNTEIPRTTGRGYRYLAVMCGINDIVGSIPEATTEANLDAIYAAAVADGVYRVLAMTIIPSAVPPWSTIAPYNAHIAAQATDTIRIVDTGTAFGGASPDWGLYAGDHVHPNAAGQTLMVNMLAAAMVAP